MDGRPVEVRPSHPGAMEGRSGSSLLAPSVSLWPLISCTAPTPCSHPICPPRPPPLPRVLSMLGHRPSFSWELLDTS